MGSIRKSGENSWEITVSAGKNPVTGEYDRVYKTVKGTKREAKKVMHELEHKVNNGTYVEPSKMTVADLLQKWYDDYVKNNLADSTQEYYDVIINSHMIPLIGQVKIKDLKSHHIKSYLNKKLEDGRLDGKEGGLSKKSVRRHYIVLNQALKYAVGELQALEKNPAKHITAPSPNAPKVQAMSQTEVDKLLDAAESWLYDFLYIAIFTGMRRGEIIGLDWDNVDLQSQKIYVRQSATMLSGGNLVLKEPKTKSSIRPIDFNNDIKEIFKERKMQQQENKEKLANKYNNEHDLVFAKADGSPYLPDHATKSFKKLARKLDLGKYRLHDLRHTHATLMLKAGVHPKIVQERLGHSSISQTLDTYSHLIPSMQKEAVKKLDNIFD